MRAILWVLAALSPSLFIAACAASDSSCPNGVCRDAAAPDLGGGGRDLSAGVEDGSVDLAVADRPRDLASTDLARVYVTTTIHAIDTNMVASSTLVSLTGVVLTTPVHARSTGNGMCTYQAWVQDPNGTAPSGIGLFTVQPPIGGQCPAPPASNGPFDGRARGDNLIVKGRLFVQTFASDGGVSIVEHSVAVDSLAPSGGSATIAATALNDPAQFGGYGAGFGAYEGMLVELTCGTGAACTGAGGKLKVVFQPSPYLWSVTGGALFGSEFAENWPGLPGANGTAYSKLVGIVNTFDTGSIEARDSADFVP